MACCSLNFGAVQDDDEGEGQASDDYASDEHRLAQQEGGEAESAAASMGIQYLGVTSLLPYAAPTTAES